MSVWPSAIFSSSSFRTERNSERPSLFFTVLMISFVICDPPMFFVSTTDKDSRKHELGESMEINAKERDHMRLYAVMRDYMRFD